MAVQEISQGHIDVTDTAVDLRAGLDDGGYIAQVNGPADAEVLFFVGGAAAPSDVDDYRIAFRRRELRFPVGEGSVAVWVRTRSARATFPVAIRSRPGTIPNMPIGHPHFDVTTLPMNHGAALAEGTYRATVTQLDPGADLLYCTASAIPSALDDYWRAGRWESFDFCSGATTVPTWIRTRTGRAVVAIDQ